jgi:adenosylhomocysteine nucleosidase
MTRLLVVAALKNELHADRAGDGVDVIYGGVGKINTAIAILAARSTLVVNYGTCGKISENLRGLLEISHVVQRDMMAMPLAPRGVTPLCHDDRLLTSGHGTAVRGTGDSFVTSTDTRLAENKIDVVDMELFAIALACKRLACHGGRSNSLPTTLTTSPTNTGRRTSPMARTCSGMYWMERFSAGLDEEQ